MRDIVWTPPAEADLAAIDAYHLSFSLRVAEAMLDRIGVAATFLVDHPHAGPPLDLGTVRKWSVRGTNYLLIYRATDTRIEILRVHHGAEDWQPPA